MSIWNAIYFVHALRDSPGASRRSALAVAALAAITLFSLSGCNAMSSPQEAGMELAVKADTSKPIRFSTHSFGAHCFGGFGCQVRYDHKFIRDRPRSDANPGIPLDSYENRLIAPYVRIQSFPPPAQVTWRSADGSSLSAEVDIGEIVRGWVTHRGDRYMQAGADPSVELEVFLVVVDRTVNVLLHNPFEQSSQVDSESGEKNLVQVFRKTY